MGRFQVVARPITTHRGAPSITTRVYDKLSKSKRGWTISELAVLLDAESDTVRKSVYRLHDDGYLLRNESESPHRYWVTSKYPAEPLPHRGTAAQRARPRVTSLPSSSSTPLFDFRPNARPCKLCGARIFFVKTEKGSLMPLDEKKRRIIVLDSKGVYMRAEAGYETHYATCPNADEFRKKGK